MRDINQKPTHVYIGRNKCGCVSAVRSDYGDKETGKDVAEFIATERTVERVDWDTYTNKVAKEPTFLACPHSLVRQEKLL